MSMDESTYNPFAESYVFITCPKCGAETKLMRVEKFPGFKGEVRMYVCDACQHNNEVIVQT